ncbi:TetR/AcrR family transcriptional regulator [Alteromonas sediminis]|uniref:TetR/AcrR family transcriptional regulator n=1 Tax=Alteromonas sediminis TaxID=2259342 RepID=A0A3N5Y1T8_9ALTE|nr:TetR/AcrR family transcriptional regulator [Alteromonas sediminis]RPJ66546.1 TetR/AcrR family transcriptional regulator [Alteromonas sediminis]
MTQKRTSKRDHLVEVAQKLFYREGIKGTGIDAVLEHAGVAKRTLYNHFKSKDELVIATLHRRDQEFIDMIKAGIRKFEPKQPGEKRFAGVLAFFDVIDEWTRSRQFSGCMFINASAEYLRKEDPIHAVCALHKKLVIQLLEELLVPVKPVNSRALAEQLAILADGAIVNAHTTNISDAALIAKSIAEILLNNEESNT